MTGETRRQVEHLLPLAFAFLLRWLSLWQAVALSLAAMAYGMWISPRINRAGVREDERRRGFSRGKFAYALAVLALILVFHDRIHVAAGAWAVLSVGDSLSNVVGRAVNGRKLPWSPDKTWAGSAAFWLGAWPAAWILVLWTAAGTGAATPPAAAVFLVCCLAAFAAAVVESLPLPLDDNLTSPASAAIVLALMI